MKKQVFIINGSAGVGKDTFVSLVSTAFNGSVVNFSSVDKVKSIAKMIGWNGGKSEIDRKFLSDLKLLCANYNDMPFKSIVEKVEDFNSSCSSMLFIHIREPEEILRAKNAFNAKTILVKRDSVKHITSNMADKNVFDYQYDIVINNDSDLEGLSKKAFQFLIDFKIDEIKDSY